MPKLREPPTDKIKRQLLANLGYYCTIKGVDREQQRLAMRISHTTFDRRKQDPGKYTVDELIGISLKLKIPLANLFSNLEVVSNEGSAPDVHIR